MGENLHYISLTRLNNAQISFSHTAAADVIMSDQSSGFYALVRATFGDEKC